MIKTVIKVRPEMIQDTNAFMPYLERYIGKINNDFGRNLFLHSWQVDESVEEELADVKTVELSLKSNYTT